MQSRDYLKKQFEQIGEAIAKSLANILKVKFDTLDQKQLTFNNFDNKVIDLLQIPLEEFKPKIEKLPTDILQNLSLLLFEVSSIPEHKEESQLKINAINSLLTEKHNTLDFNHYLRNKD